MIDSDLGATNASFEWLSVAVAKKDWRAATRLAINLISRNELETGRRDHDAKARFAVLAGQDQEVFAVIGLKKGEIVHEEVVSKGTLNRALVHPRETFHGSLAAGADTLLVSHNHPSGDDTPSAADRDVTARLKQCGELLGIRVEEHYIVTKNANGVDLYAIEEDKHYRGVVDFGASLSEFQGSSIFTQAQAQELMEVLKTPYRAGVRSEVGNTAELAAYLVKNADLDKRSADHVVLMDGSGAAVSVKDLPSDLPLKDKLQYVATSAVQARAGSVIYCPAAEGQDLVRTAKTYAGKDFTDKMKLIGIECQDVLAVAVRQGGVEIYSNEAARSFVIPLDTGRQTAISPQPEPVRVQPAAPQEERRAGLSALPSGGGEQLNLWERASARRPELGNTGGAQELSRDNAGRQNAPARFANGAAAELQDFRSRLGRAGLPGDGRSVDPVTSRDLANIQSQLYSGTVLQRPAAAALARENMNHDLNRVPAGGGAQERSIERGQPDHGVGD